VANVVASTFNTCCDTARNRYLNESIEQGWSARALERQIGVLYYERLLSSQDGFLVKQEALNKTSVLATSASDYLRDLYILDFLNLPAQNVLENDIEHGIIDNLQKFHNTVHLSGVLTHEQTNLVQSIHLNTSF
jgi:predicted nuclease of restriction endonuclease-like (RecB) superfamily